MLFVIMALSVVAFFSLDNLQKKSRDARRVSDMNTLQDIMARTISQRGVDGYKLACPGVGAVSKCLGGKLQEFFPSIGNLNDPGFVANSCANCVDGTICNYAITNLEKDSFQVNFYLEKGINGEKPGCYNLTKDGVVKMK